ncbi:cyclin-P4-1 [Iris pallida]|uniref:Cyclin n=1 Tax=Iris pallida TaxID=29817 RepID=A0AAX6IL10_IRIPA|nr:cyclin-P4-1 [Iris pallida]
MAELVEDPHATPRVVSILSSLLERVAEHNDRSARRKPSASATLQAQAVSAFQGLSKPAISVRAYLERIFRYANCSPSCYVVAYIYLDRFVHRHPAVLIDSFNVHRFLITSVLTAVKFMDDIYYNNAYFAKVGGVSLMEMNYLEVDFLFGVGFELNVTPVVFTSYCSILQSEMYSECPPPPPPPPPPRMLCSLLSEEESSSCQQKQQQLAAVSREVFGT